ncbi:MAG TPA: undecaprenyl-phosphate glucose phosphotransferase [Planctomycetota bacterium]|nr:undecaprenyl-phosphate glucose phosphotransferase [Planctomycetota bacterium]
MVKPHRHTYFTLAVVFDVILVAAAWVLCWVLRFRTGWQHANDASTHLVEFLKILPIVELCTLFALGFVGLYRAGGRRSPLGESMQIVKGAVLGWLLMLAALEYYSVNPYSRGLRFIFLFVNPVALMGSRAVLRVVLRGLSRRGWGVRTAAIVGTGRLAQKILDALRNDPSMGLRVEYLLGEEEGVREEVRGVPVLAPASKLLEIMREHPVDTVFVAMPASKSDRLESVLDALAKLPVSVGVVPDFKGVATLNTGVDELGGVPVIRLVDSPIQGWYSVAKRVIDVVGSVVLLTVLLVLLGLPMLVTVLLVKLTGHGPVLFRQTRMGLGGKPFTILKFRTMPVDAEEETGPVWASASDPRCTRFGAFLRRTSLDELPQLLNVLRGDMSLVGPRPERPHFVQEFTKTLPAYMLRHNVKAGMTGWAQINGLRGDTSPKKRLQYDLHYINNWSLGFDLFILLVTFIQLVTPFAGFRDKNAH